MSYEIREDHGCRRTVVLALIAELAAHEHLGWPAPFRVPLPFVHPSSAPGRSAAGPAAGPLR